MSPLHITDPESVAASFLKVLWRHDVPDDPRWLYSELGDERYERRKIEVFPDGRWGFADELEEVGGSSLGERATPSLEEINADPQFEAVEIAREEFEALWAARRRAVPMTDFPLDRTITEAFLVALFPVEGAEPSALRDELGDKRGHAHLEVRRFVGPGASPRAVATFLVQELGLKPPPDWTALSGDEARALVTCLLARDLAYDAPTMPQAVAEQLAVRVCEALSEDAVFFTNADPARESRGWHPMTTATFDTGVVAVKTDRVALFWVEDED